MGIRVRASRKAYFAARRKANPELVRAYKRAAKDREQPPTVIGIDGEGVTVNGRHLYTYLAAWTSEECVLTVENPEGLRPEQVFEFLLSVKRAYPNSMLVGFSLGYDYSKWIEGLPDKAIYLLARPESRKGKKVPRPIRWNGFQLNYLRGRFSLARLIPGEHRTSSEGNRFCDDSCKGCKAEKKGGVVIWDVWGFFQGTFVDACMKWGVVTKAEYDYLKGMKSRRSTFSVKDWEDVKVYCGIECQRLARLVTALREAHLSADIPLKSYYGAGSTATSLLGKMGVKDHMPKGEFSPELNYAIACSFFGGRFEIGRFGPVRTECHSYDIASAYPYHLTAMPCLACGKWVRRHRIPNDARFGFVRYSLPPSRIVKVMKGGVSDMPWGPFPFRQTDGTIVYPVTSGGGWTTLDEYRTAESRWPNVWPKEAWIYETDCDHQPFGQLASIYNLRLEWGKESRGIVVKLGPNSCYGKVAQSIGDKPPFQCFAWASWITGCTRAQLLRLIAESPVEVINSATDGIISTVPLPRETPRETGTRDAAIRWGKCADCGKLKASCGCPEFVPTTLGTWEAKTIPGGMHLIRPGIAFPLTSELEAEVKGRGIGKAVLKSHRAQVLDNWEKHGPRPFTVTGDIFHGMKSATAVDSKGYKRAANYGTWSKRVTQVSYMPEPKRPFALTEDGRLCTWALGKDLVSQPYKRILGAVGIPPGHVQALIAEKELQAEQPDREQPEEEGEL